MTTTERPEGKPPHPLVKKSLDKDLSRFESVEAAVRPAAHRLAAFGLGLVFLVLSGGFAALWIGALPNPLFLVIAAVLGGYMALNIGANDVANNVAPAVGARALTMAGALAIAAVFEAAGALIAGGDVVETISKGIVDPARVADPDVFVWAMMAALLSAALWVNLATYLGAPVSTTHAIVGGVVGSGIAAAGVGAVDWQTMGAIAVSWVISPVLGGIVAAAFLAFIKINIIYQDDKIAAAKRWVPALLAIMAASFGCYLVMKGLRNVWHPGVWAIAAIGVAIYAATHAALKPWVARRAAGLENRNQSLRILFHPPLICSAALLSFAHGANDVANAVGPLAAIYHSAVAHGVAAEVTIPLWVMLIGAAGISLGLALFGPRLVRMVGEQITKMNPMRAYCVALSAAVTVIVASALGLPVSSTHIAVGAVFGVGFFREFYTRHSARRRTYIARQLPANARAKDDDDSDDEIPARRKLVRRAHFVTILAAWVVTVPASALLAAATYYALTLIG
jgi:PiT family inorganic phosphate transporter